ncbi:MAG: aminoacyl-tRNA hydrolase [Erysipelotrichaceae bacterium]|nr:aminoacyl-tRNA hydrolase [Solobacterium sp.]MDD7776351.1 aminoacyl-tRNA hydrolase [Solobacterium sp.]MDY2953291.1 aminoacyl-tRNA hydrolase [Erysipelotrichaceae bacterium]MDY5402387.1 aminoacyl-tRNA hydrolase [Erysipelotrichaceae bacterium]
MKLIVGLGNPGKKYENTRHNTGFAVIDRTLAKLNVELDKNKFNADYTMINRNGEKFYILKPLTYMNLSGEAVAPFMKYFGIEPEDLVVVHDDLDLPVGKIRLRQSGSCGGQNGMRNIIDLLGDSNIKRIRVGIGKDPLIPVVDYVLGKTKKEDLEVYNQALDKASDALIYWLDHDDFSKVMSNFN